MAFVTALQLAPVQERCGTCADGMEILSAPGRIRVVDDLRPDRDSNAGTYRLGGRFAQGVKLHVSRLAAICGVRE